MQTRVLVVVVGMWLLTLIALTGWPLVARDRYFTFASVSAEDRQRISRDGTLCQPLTVNEALWVRCPPGARP